MDKLVDIIFGGNAGSEGKGKFAGYLALSQKYKHAVANFFPNSGHTWVDDDGFKVITRVLPSSLVNRNIQLYIGPGAAINLEVLKQEIDDFNAKFGIVDRLHIHPRAVIVTEEHIEMEKNADLEQRIGSTQKGGSAAMSEKAMRKQGLLLAGDSPELHRFITDTDHLLHEAILKKEEILIEGAQGFELDINYGYKYPYITSRQTTPAQLLADCGLPISSVRNLYCVIRTYPIRVGGNSGELASQEIDFNTIEKRSNAPSDVDLAEKEITTVTGRPRRVFEQSLERLKYMIRITNPSFVCLNFIQYINYSDLNKMKYEELSSASKVCIDNLERELDVEIRYIGTGEQNGHIIVRG